MHGKLLSDFGLQRRGLVNEFWVWVLHLFRINTQAPASIHALLSATLIERLTPAVRKLWIFAFCNAIWCLWTKRNKLRYDGGSFQLNIFKHFFLLSLKDSASLYFSYFTNSAGALPVFNLLGLSPLRLKAPWFIQVNWCPPSGDWLKVNTDGSFKGFQAAGFGGVFRDSEGLFKGAFAHRIIVSSAIEAELSAVMEAIKVASERGWQKLWLETDSVLVVHYFKAPQLVPWKLRVAWANCVQCVQLMQFKVSHIYREGNALADKLADFGATNMGSIWYIKVPSFVTGLYGRDLTSGTNYRFG
ncbi:hypothetical protein ABKV19_014599 [Rosa sericea]